MAYQTDKFLFSFTCLCSHFSNILEVTDEFTNPELDGYNLMKYLLDHVGEDINKPLICGPNSGMTMLNSAIKYNNKRMIDLLLTYPTLKFNLYI